MLADDELGAGNSIFVNAYRIASLVPGAVEEFLRHQNTVVYLRRTATEDMEFLGERIRKGDLNVRVVDAAGKPEVADTCALSKADARWERASTADAVHRCLEALPPAQREAFLLNAKMWLLVYGSTILIVAGGFLLFFRFFF